MDGLAVPATKVRFFISMTCSVASLARAQYDILEMHIGQCLKGQCLKKRLKFSRICLLHTYNCTSSH